MISKRLQLHSIRSDNDYLIINFFTFNYHFYKVDFSVFICIGIFTARVDFYLVMALFIIVLISFFYDSEIYILCFIILCV